jgi:hypothetical protein
MSLPVCGENATPENFAHMIDEVSSPNPGSVAAGAIGYRSECG